VPCYYVVINRKTTKFESDSQPSCCFMSKSVGCYQSQNYKIWEQFTTRRKVGISKHRLLSIAKLQNLKQFTTVYCSLCLATTLLSIAKLQNLKAIHNERESLPIGVHVVINHKTTKFESNSQLLIRYSYNSLSCYQSQNYKIWKQFTTILHDKDTSIMLLSIAKLQNLKAIHNQSLPIVHL